MLTLAVTQIHDKFSDSFCLCIRWLLVGACSIAHASQGTESQCHATSLSFLRPEQNLQKIENNVGIPHFQPFQSMVSYFQPFPLTYKSFSATSSSFQPFPSMLYNFQSLYLTFPTFSATSPESHCLLVIPWAISKFEKMQFFVCFSGFFWVTSWDSVPILTRIKHILLLCDYYCKNLLNWDQYFF